MLIGIDASRAAKKQRTGVEEYTYQVISRLARQDRENQYILYTDQPLPAELKKKLPENWRVKVIPLFRFWTQYRLPQELRRDRPDVVWFPASAMPIGYHGKKVATIHGLEFEYFPDAYGWRQRWYLRWSTGYALRRASRIIAVSNNTKQDLIKKYHAGTNRITVVPNGYSYYQPSPDMKPLLEKFGLSPQQFFIFTGRLERRKNIKRLISAYENLRRQTDWTGRLVLAGKFGLGREEIEAAARQSVFNKDIVFPGYQQKADLSTLVQQASALVFPSLYEGFGLPILEAFALGTPVVCSRTASLPEVGGPGAIYVDPESVESISRGLRLVLEESREKRAALRRQQLQKFSWDICAKGIRNVLVESARGN